jgi:deazaflavin-dependent oxidoreductase (nitroreductase family)
VIEATAPAPSVEATPRLPYRPVLSRLLRPLQRGFLVVNRWVAGPMLRSPFGRFAGNPFNGYLLILRTRGRRTGLTREAPLGYVLLDGFVYCVAGYGVATPWYRNLLDSPTVEVVLPGRTIQGIAGPVADDAEWLRAYRALITSFGLVGRLVDGDPHRVDDATLLATHRSLPVVRIRALEPPGPIVGGTWDPGGRGWLAVWAVTLELIAGSVWLLIRRRHQEPRPQ